MWHGYQISIGLTHPPGVITVAAALFPYDPAHQTFVNVYEGNALVTQAILDKDRARFEHITGTRQGTWYYFVRSATGHEAWHLLCKRAPLVLHMDTRGTSCLASRLAPDYGLRRRCCASCPLVTTSDEVWACPEQNRSQCTCEASPNVCLQTQSPTS